ncbi:MAG: DUF167 domain-containing protein [Candidatus Moranbacteria bacterium]|jgi:uncharacterized protein (TIGR00251 family)|nr:DUF167 domain-containing protein [Candidatus Moranbacteria bacterium]MDD5652322.1 DUF167 domain-containing protein [Candidatus Moranbacteria bacterium]MDX9855966.1 DUF167 domain-containing protein [Candidatus Moranbacteria bacterium]
MRIYVKVIPRSSRNEVKEIGENEYRVKVTAPPVDGEANSMLIKVLAKYFNVPKSSLNIVGGRSAKIKIIDIM